jgi:kynurenine formamidase
MSDDPASPAAGVAGATGAPGSETFDDTMFDVAAVEAGAWVPGPYGPGDQRGSFNEVTPEKTAQALALLRPGEPVETYSLAETMGNGFPAWGDRAYEQRLVITGYTPPPDFAGTLTDPEPQELGRKCIHEERVSLTYNMGTKINGLHHVGVADMLYNGFKGPEIAATWGTTHLGAETMGPIVTRGVVVDVVGWMVAAGRSDRYVLTPAGRPVLRSRYRITVEDIEATLAWEGIDRPIGPGDAVLLRTGWRELIEVDPERYLGAIPPGPYLRECRYLAARRPALLASDTWNFETIDPDVVSGYSMACHQELSTRFGIRIGEAVPTDVLADAGMYEFVFCLSPTLARGAVASNTPPLALAQPPVRS